MAAPAEQYDHLLPQSPRQQRQQRPQVQYSQPPQYHQHQTKPRSFSFRSDKSHQSSGSKSELHETHEESKRLHSKVDPSLAINEAEPSAVAAMMTQSNHVPLRSMQHKDHWGNPIAEPDKSNPTRNRWERPLDTIRGFEVAIDGGYSRKTMMHRSETDSVANWNRRSSFRPQNQPRFPQDSYYGSRPPSTFRPDTQYGAANAGTARSSYMDAQGYGTGYSRPVPRERSQRMHSESHYQIYGREQNVYPMPHKGRSYETVTSAAPSGNSDPAGYQTDPTSSDNSSVDRTSPAKRHEPANDYGIGFSQPQAYQAPNFSVGCSNINFSQPLPAAAAAGPDQYDSGPASRPAAPRKQPSTPVRQDSQPRAESPEKRKSWFTCRFSKGS